MLVGAQDHVARYAAGIAATAVLQSWPFLAGSLTLACEYTSTACLVRCPWQALLDWLHVLRFAVSVQLGTQTSCKHKPFWSRPAGANKSAGLYRHGFGWPAPPLCARHGFVPTGEASLSAIGLRFSDTALGSTN